MKGKFCFEHVEWVLGVWVLREFVQMKSWCLVDVRDVYGAAIKFLE
jgi:hypothetical protein